MASASAKCKCIMLKADGTKQELAVDMTSGWEAKLIGGPVTIIGMYEAIDTIVLGVDQDDLEEADLSKLPTNKHKLPPPLNDEEIVGDLVLFRNDDNAEPVDLTMAEWTEFSENPEAEKYLKAIELRRQRESEMDEEAFDEEDDEEEDEGDDDEEDDEEEEEDDEEEEEEPSTKKKASAPAAGEKGAKRAKA